MGDDHPEAPAAAELLQIVEETPGMAATAEHDRL